MCGRFTLRTSARDVVEEFDLLETPSLTPRVNIAPTQPVPVVRVPGQLEFLRWGLIPSWADDPKIGARMINARADGVATKPAFRRAFQSRRCLIIADSFYEWRNREPFCFRRRDGRPFAFAGLWDRWKGIESCTIITTEPNALLADYHDRMPVILGPQERQRWLAEADQTLLKPYPNDDFEVTRVEQPLIPDPVLPEPQTATPEL